MPKVFEPYHPSEISEKNKVIDGNAFSQDIKVVDGQRFESKENAISDNAEIPTADAPFKVYSALISQHGANNPTAIVLQNTLGGTPVWSRNVTGTIQIALAGKFPQNKRGIIWGVLKNGDNVNGYIIETDTGYSDDLIEFYCFDSSFNGFYADGLDKVFIEIRVYN